MPKEPSVLDGGLPHGYKGVPRGQKVEFTDKESGEKFTRTINRELGTDLFSAYPEEKPNQCRFIDCRINGEYEYEILKPRLTTSVPFDIRGAA